MIRAFGLLLCVVIRCSLAAEPETQYAFESVRIAAARADEPRLKTLSVERASKYLEDGTAAWNGTRNCITCHTNGTYLIVRPQLNAYLGMPDEKVRRFAIDQLRQKKQASLESLKQSINPAQVVYLAAGLAEWDAHTTAKLSPETEEALGLMFELQEASGTWGSLDCWAPYESDAFHLATVAITAATVAPGWRGKMGDKPIQEQLKRLEDYLRKTAAPHDYARTSLMTTTARVPNLLDESQTAEIVRMVRGKQQPDGGWSVRSFAKPEEWGRGNRAEKLRSEAEFREPESDGHMTGLAIIALRSAGVPTTDTQVQKGIAWLKVNQRESGRWWTRSLNTDTFHFITYSGTALPLLALAQCGELSEAK